ncbi:serine protease [Paracoccaceae bacterium]|nr:serine protease [Paracoccaceae bacterium]
MMKRWALQICMVVVALVGGAGESSAAGCSQSSAHLCSDRGLCNIVDKRLTGRWSTYPPFTSYVQEGKRRGLNCVKFKKKVLPKSLLHILFNKLSNDQRKVIQSKLAEKEFYTSAIDGLYGRGTAAALKAYNKEYLGNADLGKSANVKTLIDTVLDLKPKTISPATQVPQVEDTYKVASGTGFYISNDSHIITNHHVINGCKDIKVHSKGETLKTVKIADDRQNDLALLKVSYKPSHVFPLSNDSPYPLQDIVVAGFPFGDRVSSSLKFTKGIVSSLSGIGNNYSEIQIDAAIQPGNSGGPIMDEYGNIIAVAVAKLDMKKILKDYGVIPENTNFGIKASAVKNLLEGNAVAFKKPNTEVVSKQELSRIATDGTVFLSCWMTVAQIEDMKNRKVLFTDLQ